MRMIRFRENSARTRQTAQRRAAGVLLALCLCCSPAFAAHTEIRAFSARIDNKPAGSYTMSIVEGKDGRTDMTAEASISVRMYWVKTYTYSYSGTEAWKAGRLQELKSKANDDGKALGVVAWATVDGLTVWAGGKQRPTKGDAWTTTYWRLPDPALRNGLIHLLDADTGKDLYATLKLVDWQEFNVAGQKQKCSHYRLAGEKLNVELWYDAGERLVREQLVEDGHTLILELAGIR
jgi:hypothetical protein